VMQPLNRAQLSPHENVAGIGSGERRAGQQRRARIRAPAASAERGSSADPHRAPGNGPPSSASLVRIARPIRAQLSSRRSTGRARSIRRRTRGRSSRPLNGTTGWRSRSGGIRRPSPRPTRSTRSTRFIAPIDGEVDVFFYEGVGGVTPNIWFRESADLLAEEFVTKPIASDIDLRSGARTRVFELNYTSEGTDFFFQQAVIVAGDRAWDINWYSTAGREDADRELFLRFVGTFEPVAE